MFGNRSRSNKPPHCSFCNRTDAAAADLIPLPINDVYSCADCVAVCHGILADHHRNEKDMPPVKRITSDRTTTVRHSAAWYGLAELWRAR